MHAFIARAFLLVFAAVPQSATLQPPPPVVAIDAGHGGDTPGAVGVCGLREKDLTLAIAGRLRQALTRSGVASPLMLRDRDTNPSLARRADRANAAHAMLLISIHANASPSSRPRGVETFFLSNTAADGRLLRLARRENDGAATESATDTDDIALRRVLTGLTLDAAHTESQALALRIQDVLGARTRSRARGVMQAPLHLLRGARMAAVLVEVGFLTHPQECRRLQKSWYRQLVADALATAIVTHLQDYPVGERSRFLSARGN